MKNTLKRRLSRRFPSLLYAKAWWVARRDQLAPLRSSYAQCGEDVILERLLREKEALTLPYIDVGGNHPTRLSNTYRLYRLGARGIVIEPNRRLLDLHRTIRPEDQQLMIGCGDRPEVLRF